MGGRPPRFQTAALDALLESSQFFLTDVLSGSNVLACHAKRVTIMPKDLRALKAVLGIFRVEIGE